MDDKRDPCAGVAPQALDDELVPLAVAAQVAYFQLTRINTRLDDEATLAEVVRLTSIALAQVAPIYAASGGRQGSRLSEDDIERLLFRSARDGKAPPPLDDVHIRRGDLRIALATLKDAREFFGRP